MLIKTPARFTLIGLSLGYLAFEIIRRELQRLERLILMAWRGNREPQLSRTTEDRPPASLLRKAALDPGIIGGLPVAIGGFLHEHVRPLRVENPEIGRLIDICSKRPRPPVRAASLNDSKK